MGMAQQIERRLARRLLPSVRELPSVVDPRATQRERAFSVGGRDVRVQWRDVTSPMGRFGGGWQVEAGVQIGKSTVIVNLGVFSVRIDRRRA
jgi:hypothetical protein